MPSGLFLTQDAQSCEVIFLEGVLKMSVDVVKSKEAGKLLRSLAVEVETLPTVEKIDWGNLLKMIMEILPLILALFQSRES